MGRVIAARSFVGGSPYRDDDGHGTFVAGEIAANPSNGVGIAGLAFNARLMIAQGGRAATGDVSLPAEVAAIRWAANNGARVINLSLGGVRDPLDPQLDTYSPLEQAAIEYAYSKGAVVVAAVGNGPESPATPWNYADYPAALPHVIGVSAVREDGSVPQYSNRDAVYIDIAAPGDDIFSTIPTNLVDDGAAVREPAVLGLRPDRVPRRDRHVVRGAAGVGCRRAAARRRTRRSDPEQVSWLLERSATDDDPSTGCSQCPPGRDALTGWGTLDVDNALTMLTSGVQLPAPDHYEPNDDAGPWAHDLPPLPRTITASLDYWDDNVDVYRVQLTKGQRLYARLTPSVTATVRLALWAPGTQRVESLDLTNVRLAQSHRSGLQARLAYRARMSGTYYLEAKLISQVARPRAVRAVAQPPFRLSSSAATSRSTRAGDPTTITPGGTSFVTTAPAPTKASSPISTPGQRIGAAADACAATDRRALHQRLAAARCGP